VIRLNRTGAAVATALLVAAVALGATPATAHHRPGPCDFHISEDETIRQFSKRRIVCAVQRFGPVPGGTTRAVCIARRESGLDPKATSSPTGQYLGLFQYDRDFWPARYRGHTRPGWELPTRAVNGRTNAVVTIRMVFSVGTWKGAGWPRKAC
jgi:hypothetical protein